MTRNRVLPSLVALAVVGAAVAALGAARAEHVEAQSPAPAGTPRPSARQALFREEPVVERLPNGLTVVTLPWESPGIVAYYTLVRTGSRDEVEPGHSGFAHLFEHMMFRGTERFPEKAYERALQGFGADNNAYTTEDFTLYTVLAPTAALETVVDLEADRFQHLRYDETQFRTETGAVLGEYMKSASDPSMKMWEALSELAFTRHTYGHTTIGYLRDVEAMPEKLEYSRRFFERFYTPDNCAVIVVGDFERDRLMTVVRETYGPWRGRRARPNIAAEPEPRSGGARHLEWEGESPPRLLLGYRTPSYDGGAGRADDRAAALRETVALEILHGLLFSESSALYQRLVVTEQKVLELSSWGGWHHRDPHLFVVDATLRPGEAFEPVRDAIQTAVDEVARGATPATRVADVRANLRYGMLMDLETPASVAELLAQAIAVAGDLATIDAYHEALNAVTPDDVARAAARYLVPSRRFVVTLAPRAGGAPGAP